MKGGERNGVWGRVGPMALRSTSKGWRLGLGLALGFWADAWVLGWDLDVAAGMASVMGACLLKFLVA